MTGNEQILNFMLRQIRPDFTAQYSYFIEGVVPHSRLMYNPTDKTFGTYIYCGTNDIYALTTFSELSKSDSQELDHCIRMGKFRLIQKGRKFPLSEDEIVMLNIGIKPLPEFAKGQKFIVTTGTYTYIGEPGFVIPKGSVGIYNGKENIFHGVIVNGKPVSIPKAVVAVCNSPKITASRKSFKTFKYQ